MQAAVPNRILYILPVVLFFVIVGYLARTLLLPPPVELIDRPVPEFIYEALFVDDPGLQTADLNGEKAIIVNFFASWCVPCELEHKVITKMAELKIAPVYGIAYKDRPDPARKWLGRLGNPYARASIDQDGLSGRLWRFSGIPSTYVIGPDGRVRYIHIGAMSEQTLEDQILPVLRSISR